MARVHREALRPSYSIPELAMQMNLHRRSVARMIKRGTIPMRSDRRVYVDDMRERAPEVLASIMLVRRLA